MFCGVGPFTIPIAKIAKNVTAIVGNIAIVKFDGKLTKNQKLTAIKEILNKNKNVNTIFEKIGMVQGEERIPKLKKLIGNSSVALI